MLMSVMASGLPHQDVDADDGLESDSIEWN